MKRTPRSRLESVRGRRAPRLAAAGVALLLVVLVALLLSTVRALVQARAERDAARADLARIDDALQAMVVHGAEATAQMHVERVERCAPEEYAGGVYY